MKEVEQLSREQLKNVLGGYMDGTGGGTDGGTTEKKCGGSCYKYYMSGPAEEGKCEPEIVRGYKGATMTICVCSISGGGDCN